MKRLGICTRLQGKRLIYVDTNHWVNLRHVVLGAPNANPIYGDILHVLKKVHKRQKLLCPVSAGMITELMKQTSTRDATARLMDELSDGVCLRDWISVSKEEAKALAMKTLAPSTVRPPLLLWTRVADCLGLLQDLAGNKQLETYVAFGWIDVYWKCGVFEYSQIPNWIEPTGVFGPLFAETANAEATACRESHTSFQSALAYARSSIAGALGGDLSIALAEVGRGLPGAPATEIQTLFDGILASTESQDLPTVQVMSRIFASVVASNRKVKRNDSIDYTHAAQAIPYCNALFCDTPMKHLLLDERLGFREKYGVEILSEPLEILEYLRSHCQHRG